MFGSLPSWASFAIILLVLLCMVAMVMGASTRSAYGGGDDEYRGSGIMSGITSAP